MPLSLMIIIIITLVVFYIQKKKIKKPLDKFLKI